MLRRLETLTSFFAMMLALVVEAAIVYWLFGHRLVRAAPESPLNFVGEWTGVALPQGWLVGALLVLVYRVCAMFIPPANFTGNDLNHNRRAFPRLWCLAMTLAAMQALLFLLGNTAA
jgi:hypothetical protein